MAERRATDHRSGPRLSKGPRNGPSYQQALTLMAKRAALHCGGCGSPVGVIELTGMRGGIAGRFPVCQACWVHWNPVDPLEVAS